MNCVNMYNSICHKLITYYRQIYIILYFVLQKSIIRSYFSIVKHSIFLVFNHLCCFVEALSLMNAKYFYLNLVTQVCIIHVAYTNVTISNQQYFHFTFIQDDYVLVTRIISCPDWPPADMPEFKAFDLVERVKELQAQKDGGPIIVVDR